MKNQQLKDWFSSEEVAKLSGLSPVMVDYLCREGILKPTLEPNPGRGSPRKYSFGDILILRAIYQLLKYGVSVAKLKKSLNSLKKYYKDIQPGAAVKKYLVTDGKAIYFQEKKKLLVDLSSNGQLVFAFVLDLDQLNSEIQRKALNYSPKKRSKVA